MYKKPMKPIQIDLSELKYDRNHVIQIKYDGLRATVQDGKLRTNSLKQFPNKQLKAITFPPELEGLDGELLIPDITDSAAFRRTASICMSINGDISKIVFIVYDRMCTGPFAVRYIKIEDLLNKHKDKVPLAMERAPIFMGNPDLGDDNPNLSLISALIEQRYEGVIVRNLNSWYKHGRTTIKENIMYKIKPFIDDEAVIVGFKEEMENLSPLEINELGRAERKKSKSMLRGKGRLGAFIVRHEKFGEFSISASMEDREKYFLWKTRESLIGKLVTFKYLSIGMKDKPRIPIFKGIRNEIDL